MSNHGHFLLWPRADGELSEVMRWLTLTHTQRWHANRHTSGSGPIHQGRFQSFPVQCDEHFLSHPAEAYLGPENRQPKGAFSEQRGAT
jgi:putative transposase